MHHVRLIGSIQFVSSAAATARKREGKNQKQTRSVPCCVECVLCVLFLIRLFIRTHSRLESKRLKWKWCYCQIDIEPTRERRDTKWFAIPKLPHDDIKPLYCYVNAWKYPKHFFNCIFTTCTCVCVYWVCVLCIFASITPPIYYDLTR